jgi:4-amino-4-deoxy-L-arabinose transferase-like glycosyltransferase
MNRQKYFASWRHPPDFYLLGLTGAAAVLLFINLGNVPLKDWDEGLVAQVAREIWQAPAGSLTWLHPTLWGNPYFNKPPLMHWLIAGLYSIAGVSEWTTRLPSACLTLLSVPLFYKIGRELFHQRLPALCATLVYLTSLPVVRNGRFAMLDGAILCFFLLLLWYLLQARRNYQFLLGVGLAFGTLCLVKGLMVAVLLGSIALLFLAWDTPRLLRQPYLWLGLGLGSLPALGWYLAQWFHYGWPFLSQNLIEQSAQRIWTNVENNGAPPWYYLLELLKNAPWVIFLPAGCDLAWKNRNWSWAKLALVWAGVYLLAISLMSTKLPWYVVPLLPAVALLVGAQLAEMFQQGHQVGVIQLLPERYARGWWISLAVVAIGGWLGAISFIAQAKFDVALVLATIAGALTVSAWLIAQQNSQFIGVLGWGTYLALLILLTSPHWAWELGEAYPVRPVAEMIQQHVPANQPIYTSYAYSRPSLNFYSQHQVHPAPLKELKRRWRRETPFLLIDQPTLAALKIQPQRIVAQTETWLLVTKAKI